VLGLAKYGQSANGAGKFQETETFMSRLLPIGDLFFGRERRRRNNRGRGRNNRNNHRGRRHN
jgi:hypothetical protein